MNLTPAELVWSRQLYYMLSLSTSGERRLQNVPEGEGAEAWKAFSDNFEPKTTARYVGVFRQILLYDFGVPTQLIVRIEQFRHLVRKYEEQSDESVTANVRDAFFHAGIKDASIRDHLALHAGGLSSFDKMATEVSTVARTRNENDIVPVDVSVLSRVKERARTARAETVRARTVRGRRMARMARTRLSPSRRIRTRTRSVSTVTNAPRESRLSKEEER